MACQRIWAWPLAGSFVLALGQFGADSFAGPVSAVVENIVDGDTVDVRARIWLGQVLSVRVRIDGVDAPELRSSCTEERHRAVEAREFLARRLLKQEVTLSRIAYDKYGGRVLAEINDADGSVAEALIKAGLARRYDGEARQPWCPPG